MLAVMLQHFWLPSLLGACSIAPDRERGKNFKQACFQSSHIRLNKSCFEVYLIVIISGGTRNANKCSGKADEWVMTKKVYWLDGAFCKYQVFVLLGHCFDIPMQSESLVNSQAEFSKYLLKNKVGCIEVSYRPISHLSAVSFSLSLSTLLLAASGGLCILHIFCREIAKNNSIIASLECAIPPSAFALCVH